MKLASPPPPGRPPLKRRCSACGQLVFIQSKAARRKPRPGAAWPVFSKYLDAVQMGVRLSHTLAVCAL